ncbi:hypothetical protein [Candidatus Viridilinea mediisalina]|nr:hypothetical protein [Candidatus Viridilinea mediisalina]
MSLEEHLSESGIDLPHLLCNLHLLHDLDGVPTLVGEELRVCIWARPGG